MKALITVIAHGNGIAAFNRHRPLWEAHGLPIEVWCPENDPVPNGRSCALAQHNGPESLKRLQAILRHLRHSDADYHLVFEYDSFCLSGEVRFSPGLHGNRRTNAESPKFMAPTYANPPWTLCRQSVRLMTAAMDEWPAVHEEGEADRYLSALAWLSGVPIMEHEPPGYSEGIITERQVRRLRSRIYNGATMIHGVKQKWVLEAALQFYDERPKRLG